jgi:hypothetical protein
LVAVKVFLRWAQKPPRRYIAHSPCEGMVQRNALRANGRSAPQSWQPCTVPLSKTRTLFPTSCRS